MNNTYVRDHVDQGAISALKTAHEAAGFPPTEEFAKSLLAGKASEHIQVWETWSEEGMNKYLRGQAKWLVGEGYDLPSLLAALAA